MNPTLISEQIAYWKQESKAENDYWSKLADYLKEFQSLTGVTKYINDDAENYFEIESYKDLLIAITELTEPEIKITNVEAKVIEGRYIFNFQINGIAHELSMEDPDTDWLNEAFLDLLNEKFATIGNPKKLRMVYTTTVENGDQCFDMVFIADATFEALVQHKPKYAYSGDEEEMEEEM